MYVTRINYEAANYRKRCSRETLSPKSSSYFFVFLLHQHVAFNPDVTSRKRFYDRVRVTIATTTPRTLELKVDEDDRLVRFHRRIYRRKTTLRVSVRSSESSLLLFVPEISISSAFKLTTRPSKLRRFSCLFCFAVNVNLRSLSSPSLVFEDLID